MHLQSLSIRHLAEPLTSTCQDMGSSFCLCVRLIGQCDCFRKVEALRSVLPGYSHGMFVGFPEVNLCICQIKFLSSIPTLELNGSFVIFKYTNVKQWYQYISHSLDEFYIQADWQVLVTVITNLSLLKIECWLEYYLLSDGKCYDCGK